VLTWEGDPNDESRPAHLVRGERGGSVVRGLAGEAPAEDEQRHGHQGVPDEVPEEVQRA
jgi:hypothetical protein